MSSTASFRATFHLSIIFVCVLVCKGGILDFGQHKREGDDVYESNSSLQQDQGMIEFPALDEMTSAERAANRQRARKVATIIEKSLHMIADDILQMWAITRSEKTENDEAEVEEEAEGEGGAEKAEGADAEVTEEEKDMTTEVEANTTEGGDDKTTEGSEENGEDIKTSGEAFAKTFAEPDAKKTEVVTVGTTEGAVVKTTGGTASLKTAEETDATKTMGKDTSSPVGKDIGITEVSEGSSTTPANAEGIDLTGQTKLNTLQNPPSMRLSVDRPGTFIKSKSIHVLEV